MEIQNFFEKYPQVAVAFSGGVDSSYLLYAAKKYANRVKAYYVKSSFQPEFEYNDAVKLASSLDIDMEVIKVDVLSDSNVVANPSNRCYFCKKVIFSTICEHAVKDGFSYIIDGTNASDDEGDRPGMKALKELEVLSPLRLCNITKSEVRKLSRDAGLFTWDKPAYACLATRIRSGEVITKEALAITEKSEGFMHELGFSDFRIRKSGGRATIQVKESQFGLLMEKREQILEELGKYYDQVVCDLKCR